MEDQGKCIISLTKKQTAAQQVIGIPVIRSYKFEFFQKKRLLPADPASSQLHVRPYSSDESSKLRQGRYIPILNRMNTFGQKMDKYAKGIRQHVRLSPKLTETVKGKLSLGTRILQLGGIEKVFRKNFRVEDGEKLLKAAQCYLSTTAGPIAGLLFISTHNVAFCSERSLKFSSPSGKLLKINYKVLIPLSKIKRASTSENANRPSEKYIELVTEDKFDFWFMGFLNHQSTLKHLQQAIYQAQ